MFRSLCLLLPLTVLCLVALPAHSAEKPGTAPLTAPSALPQGEVEHLTQITVRFSEAMRPLGVMGETAENAPLRLAVPGGILPQGQFRWLDQSTLAYLFDAPVNSPIRVNAVAPAGATALSGAILEKDVRWTLWTAPLHITLASDGSELPPDGGSMILESNYPLDVASLRSKSRLTLDDKDLRFDIREYSYDSYSNGKRTLWQYQFSILVPLRQDARVTLAVEPGMALSGGFASAPGLQFSQPTYRSLKLEEWRAGWWDGKKNEMAPEEMVTVSFNNPVSRRDLLSLLQVSPPVALTRDDTGNDGRDQVSCSHSLAFDWIPRTSYTMSLKPGLKDSYGTTLDKEQSVRFKTTDYYPFLHVTPGAFMERALGGKAWLTVRNITPVTLRLRYLPWMSEHSRLAYREESGSFATLPGAIERTVSLDFSKQANTNIRHPLNIPELLGMRGPDDFKGFVELRATATDPEDRKRQIHTSRTYQITDLGLSLKAGADKSLALVTDLETGRPRSGVKLTLYSHADSVLWEGTSDQNGLAELPGGGSKMRLLKAETDSDACVLSLHGDQLPQTASNHLGKEDRDSRWAMHSVAQLPLYQPGQTVNFTIFARVFTDNRKTPNGVQKMPFGDWQAVAGEEMDLVITDPRGQTVHTQKSVTTEYGAIDGSFTLSPEANLGGYGAELRCARFAERAYDYQAFHVASFRPPDFKVDVTAPADRPALLSNETGLSAKIEAAYFSGALLPGAETVLMVGQTESHFAPPRLRDYRTLAGAHPYLYGYRGGYGDVHQLTQTLDDSGKAEFTLPHMAVEPGKPQAVSLEATVTDTTGLTTQGAASFLLHPSALYVGLRTQRVAPMHEDITIELKAAGWDDAPIQTARVRLVAERRLRDDSKETVWEKDLLLDTPQGRPFSIRFDKSGEYTLTATITDSAGRDNTARTVVYVPGPDMEWISRQGESGLELMADKDVYNPGETAGIIVNNPFDSALALVTVERKGVRSYFMQDVAGPAPVVEVPLNKADVPYVIATVTLIRGRTAPPPTEPGHDLGAPKVLYGTTCLIVDDAPPKLAVNLTTDAATYLPGDKVTISVSAADVRGQPRQAHVTLLAVDERILRAAGERTRYNPLETFSALHSHSVINADIRTRLLNLGIPLLKKLLPTGPMAYLRNAAPLAEVMASPPPPEQKTDTGQNDISIRQNFSSMAFWLAAGEVDAKGKLSTAFTLPDTLTGYRVVAVVADAGSDFTTEEISIKTAKPLQLISAMPRFLTEGDALEAHILAQNMGDKAGTVTVRAEGKNLTLETRSREIRLNAGESGRISFPLKAGTAGTGVLTVRGSMDEAKDTAQFAIPILPAAPLNTVAAAGLLEENGSYALSVQTPVPLDSRSGLEVIFAPSPAAGLSLIAEELIEYPWSCLEPRLSRAWLRIMRLRHGDTLGLEPANDDLEAVRQVLESVVKFQEHGGGFSLWPGLGRSSPYLTVFALLVNREAKPLGLAIAPDVLEEAVRYLHNQLAGRYDAPTRKRTLEQDAMIIWALADTGEAHLASQYFPLVLDLAEKTTAANPLIWGALLAASGEIPQLEKAANVRERIAAALEKSANVTPTQLHFTSHNDYGTWMTLGSNLRDNGLVLGALALVTPEYSRLESLAHWVSQGLNEKKELSTQEAIYGLWGLGTYLQHIGGNRPVSMRAAWNGKESMTKSFTRRIDAPESWVLRAKQIENDTQSTLTLQALRGRPYWTARLRYASPSLPTQPENAGFTITRAWLNPGPWNMGDVVDVSVTVTVPATRRHVLLYDPFPAGLEPLHATRTDLADAGRQYQYPWQWQESREDGMLLYAEEVHPGVYTYTYKLRAATPGVFIQRPSRVEEMYTPEVFGRTNGDTVKVGGQ